METYRLIINEEHLKAFVDHLEDTDESTRYYLSLFARKKYDTTGVVKSDKAQLKRVVAKKEDIIKKIRQMETAYGAYREGGNPIPQEALAVYIGASKRCLSKATREVLRKIGQHVDDSWFNPVSASLTAIQTSTVKNPRYFDVDIDLSEGITNHMVIKDLTDILGNVFRVVHTRGGFHMLIDLNNPKLPRDWYLIVKGTARRGIGVQMNKAIGLTPIPGCTQGGSMPVFEKIYE